MPRKLRHILMIVQAMLVMAISVQSVLDTSHHYVPPDVRAQIAEAPFALDEVLAIAGEDVSTSQHEHESAVDHAMIELGAAPQFPPLRSGAGTVAVSSALPAGYFVTTPDRPPRPAFAA